MHVERKRERVEGGGGACFLKILIKITKHKNYFIISCKAPSMFCRLL